MITVKVKHENGLDSQFVDLIVSDDRLHLLFLLNMLEKNSLVVWYEVMRSSGTSFDVITNLKDEFDFSSSDESSHALLRRYGFRYLVCLTNVI
jgi:hypothetical protein